MIISKKMEINDIFDSYFQKIGNHLVSEMSAIVDFWIGSW